MKKRLNDATWLKVREIGYSGPMRRNLGATSSCVTRMIAKEGKPDIDDIHLDLWISCTNVMLTNMKGKTHIRSIRTITDE